MGEVVYVWLASNSIKSTKESYNLNFGIKNAFVIGYILSKLQILREFMPIPFFLISFHQFYSEI